MSYDLSKANQVFHQLVHHQSKWDTFQSILDFALIPHRWHPDAEALRDARQQLIDWPGKELILQFLTHLADLQPGGFNDPIGEIYMEHFANDRLGQYFTPEPICDMNAQMIIGTDPEDGKTVLDPACGSGRMLLATAKINRHLQFYGADLDPTCCKMALLNMMLNSLTGEIAHMNSLSNEFYRGYACHTKLINGYHHPYFIEFTEPHQSRIWLRPKPVPSLEPTKPIATAPNSHPHLRQGSLF